MSQTPKIELAMLLGTGGVMSRVTSLEVRAGYSYFDVQHIDAPQYMPAGSCLAYLSSTKEPAQNLTVRAD